MLKIENTEIVGWNAAIRGMRNPMNSWDKSDSSFKEETLIDILDGDNVKKENVYVDCLDVGEKDLFLMKQLANNGPVHAKYRRMIAVYLDVTAPLYWWKEFDTYKVGTVVNSCSTMHKVAEKEFTIDDFSHEHVDENNLLWSIPHELNEWRKKYIRTTDPLVKKYYWWQIIQLLPTSYNQRRTIMLNYEVLTNIYKWRKDHKLDEWHTFCDWIETLPCSELITGIKKE